jgi:hypothetical protein
VVQRSGMSHSSIRAWRPSQATMAPVTFWIVVSAILIQKLMMSPLMKSTWKRFASYRRRQTQPCEEVDPLVEAEREHQLELAAWDEQFKKETGIDLHPKVVKGAYTEILPPGLYVEFHRSMMNQLQPPLFMQQGMMNRPMDLASLSAAQSGPGLPLVPGYEQDSAMRQQMMGREAYLRWYNTMVQEQHKRDVGLIQGLLGRGPFG